MIHVRTSISTASFNPEAPFEPVVHISFVGFKQIAQLEQIINKAINCQPEFDKDWFALVDGLHEFLAKSTKHPAA